MIAIAKVQDSQTESKLTYEKFVNLRLTDGRYEFVNGEVVKVVNTRQHEDVVAFVYKKFDREIDRLNLDLVVRQNVSIRTIASSDKQSRVPDLSVIDKQFWQSNPADYSPLQKPIQLAVEVTSTNWDDDYIDKFSEYQSLGIPEYWIVDYLAIASREFLGNPKIPTVFVNLLDENGKYQTTRFTGDDKINSRTFPEIDLTAAAILNI
ncbi:Uma2 family endonuclease [Pseudanabaena sp. Chao 1811]|uniref:Uma2 family endonuclease n=1 Tax=Pseudanabaena sp. Chao 1811 TaxID=2963092 RepID=UPI0022F3A1A0|nr:Uma2 family endonuclease [Pseudanabaena sp. Chao 1811]